VVAHTCDLSYLGGRDREDHSFEDSLGKKKKLTRSHLKKQARDRGSQL
jgi:hypothetical protein